MRTTEVKEILTLMPELLKVPYSRIISMAALRQQIDLCLARYIADIKIILN